MSYGAFEGVMPEGSYGVGRVLVWDTGEWRCEEGDARDALEGGKLLFTLEGEKLLGGRALTRMRCGKGGEEEGGEWLLMKRADEWADRERGDRVLDHEPASVLSGRVLEGVRAVGDGAVIAGVRISSGDRVVFPDAGVTNAELAAFYESAGRLMLPFGCGRPLSTVRCPEGICGDCVFSSIGARRSGWRWVWLPVVLLGVLRGR